MLRSTRTFALKISSASLLSRASVTYAGKPSFFSANASHVHLSRSSTSFRRVFDQSPASLTSVLRNNVGRKRRMFIQIQSTPNPSSLMFFPGKAVMEVRSSNFPNARVAMSSPLAKALFTIDGCTSGIEAESAVAAKVVLKDESKAKQAQALKVLEAALGTPFSGSLQVPPPKPLVIVISGPSGVGKDAVIKRLQEVRKEFHFVVTATTRLKRPDEVHGIVFYFVSKDEFQKLIEDKELLEFALVYGDYKGIPKQQVHDCISKGFDAVIRVDVQGAATIRSILGSNAVFIFLVAESEVALVKRLVEQKTDSVNKMVLRIATAREELNRLHEFDHVVVNVDGQLEKTVKTICCIIDAEKARVQQRTVTI